MEIPKIERRVVSYISFADARRGSAVCAEQPPARYVRLNGCQLANCVIVHLHLYALSLDIHHGSR